MDRHRQTPWHALKLTEVYKTLHTSEEGLSDAEAAERLKKHGRNALRSKPPKTILQMLKAQIRKRKKASAAGSRNKGINADTSQRRVQAYGNDGMCQRL